MSKINFVEKFYESKHSSSTIISDMDGLLAPSDIWAGAIPFSIDMPLNDIFARLPKEYKIEKIIEQEDLAQFKLNYQVKINKKVSHESGRFFVLKHPDYSNIYIVLCLESSDFQKRLQAMLFGLYPRVLLTFIKHKKLEFLLNDFQKKNNFSEIYIRKASMKIRIETQKKEDNNQASSSVTWFNKPLDALFTYLNQNNGWCQSVTFEAKENKNVIAKIFINRQGIVKCNRIFSKIYKYFINPVCKVMNENLILFENRSRSVRKDLSVKPLALDFDYEWFKEKENNSRFITAISKFEKSSVSILHGNPYIRLSVLDYIDGSNIDLWVLNTKQVFIVPQMRATVPALKRIINHIFDTFAEGRIIDYDQVTKQ